MPTVERYGGHEPTFQPLFDVHHGTIHRFVPPTSSSEPREVGGSGPMIPPATLQPSGYFYQPALGKIKAEARDRMS